MMTVGRASDVLISDVQQMLTQLQLAVGFEYIKLCGVFSDDLHVYTEMPNDSPVYSFSYLDKILDFVTDNNLKPWIQLSYMPEKLAKYPNKTIIRLKCQSAKFCRIMVSAGFRILAPHSCPIWS